MTKPETVNDTVDLHEAARQLEQAAHDAQVAYDAIGLGDLDWAHTHAITARAAADSAENCLRAALGDALSVDAEQSSSVGEPAGHTEGR
jgi:hypothetical protein